MKQHSKKSKHQKNRLCVKIRDSRIVDPECNPKPWVAADIGFVGGEDIHWFQRDVLKGGTVKGAEIEAWQEAADKLADLWNQIQIKIAALNQEGQK